MITTVPMIHLGYFLGVFLTPNEKPCYDQDTNYYLATYNLWICHISIFGIYLFKRLLAFFDKQFFNYFLTLIEAFWYTISLLYA
jgi:hypothetical protein